MKSTDSNRPPQRVCSACGLLMHDGYACEDALLRDEWITKGDYYPSMLFSNVDLKRRKILVPPHGSGGDDRTGSLIPSSQAPHS